MTHMKTRMDLISPELLIGVGNVLAHGVQKHGAEYPAPTRWSDQYASIMRHLVRWYAGETNDPTTPGNLPHLAMAAARINFLMMFENRGEGQDDRPMMLQKAAKWAAAQAGEAKERERDASGQSGASGGDETLVAGSYADDEFAGALAAGMLGFADQLNAADDRARTAVEGDEVPTDAEVAEAEAYAQILRDRHARANLAMAMEPERGDRRSPPKRPGLSNRRVVPDAEKNR